MNLSQCNCADPTNALEGGDSKSPKVRNSLNHPLCQLGDSAMKDEVCRALKKWNQTVRDQLREETRARIVMKYEEFGDFLRRHSKQLGREKALTLKTANPAPTGQ